MDSNELLAIMEQSSANYEAQQAGGIEAEFAAIRAERLRLIDELFNSRDYAGTPPAKPYQDPVRPLTVGFAVGMPQVLGDTLGGLGAPIRWVDSAVNGQDAGWLTSLAGVLERGGDWVSEHPWIGQDSVDRLRATVAYPIISDDGRPLYEGWLTDKEGQFDVHRRFWEATRSMSGAIGQSALPFIAELALTKGAGRVARLSEFGATALGVGAMSSVTAREGYRNLIAAGVDPDIAASRATMYGAVAGPVEYAQAVLGSRIFKTAASKMGVEGAFDWTAQHILGESGRFAMARGMTGEGLEEVIQGALLNPARTSAYAAMQERTPGWTPASDDWYTLNDAYNDFALGAGAAGFLRVSGRLLGSVANGRRSDGARATGQPTDGPVTPGERDTLLQAQATDITWAPRTVIEGQFKGIIDDLQGNGGARTGAGEDKVRGMNITKDDLLFAANLYNEDQEAGIRYYQNRLNVTALNDTTPSSDKEITERVTARNARVAKDDSIAQAFLNESSAMDRPVKTPLVAIPYNKVEARHRPIDQGKIDDDLAMKVYMGIPERVGGALLAAERQAIDELRTTLKQIWAAVPTAKIVQLNSHVAAYTPQEAQKAGKDASRMPQDAQGRVLARVDARVAFLEDGTPEIRLPRGFTLRDVKQAQLQLLGTTNGNASPNAPWNKHAQNLGLVVQEWWDRVGEAVATAAMLDPMPDVGQIQDGGKRGQVLMQRANKLMVAAQGANRTTDVAVLQATLAALQGQTETSMDLAQSLAARLETISRGLTETTDTAKARALLKAKKKGAHVVVAHMAARPDMIPAAAKPVLEAEGMGQILAEQAQGAEWIKGVMGKLAGATAQAPAQAAQAAEAVKPLSKAEEAEAVEAEAVAYAAQIDSVVDDVKRYVEGDVRETQLRTELLTKAQIQDEELASRVNRIGEEVQRLYEPSRVQVMMALAERLDVSENVIAKLPKDVVSVLLQDEGAQQVVSSMAYGRAGEESDDQIARRIVDAVRTRQIEGWRFQQATLPPVSPAELEARIQQVAERMNGTLTVLPDGTRVLTLGNYEMTIGTPGEVKDKDGKSVAGAVVRVRDTAMGGKIVAWQIELSAQANATTAAHEVVHPGIDLLLVDEKAILAAEMGRPNFDDVADEQVTQQIAVAIVTGQDFGTVGSKARMVWNKIKTVLDAMFHLRFGEAWTALKALPIELRADAVKGMVQRGEVFTREGTQRTRDQSKQAGDAEYLAAVERGDMATAQRMVDEAARAAGKTRFFRGYKKHAISDDPLGTFITNDKKVAAKYGPVRELFVGPLRIGDRTRIERMIVGDRLGGKPSDFSEEEITAEERNVTSSDVALKAKELGYNALENPFWVLYGEHEASVLDPTLLESADAVTRDDAGNVIPLSQRFNKQSPDIRYQRLSETEPYIRGEQKGRIEMLPYINELAAKVKKLSTQVTDSEEALQTEREIVGIIQSKTRFTPSRLAEFEAASEAGRAALTELTKAANPKVSTRLAEGKKIASDMLTALGVDMQPGSESEALATIEKSIDSMGQIRQLIRGLTRGIDRALLKTYIRQANATKAEARKFDAKGKTLSIWSEDYKGENLKQAKADVYADWTANVRSKDWRVWKGLATELGRLVEQNTKAISDAANEQVKAQKDMSKTMGEQGDAAAVKDPRIVTSWHKVGVDALGSPDSVFKRMGDLAHEVFYTRIMAAKDHATALARSVINPFNEALTAIGLKENSPERNAASLDQRNMMIHNGAVPMTSFEVVHVAGMLSDVGTMREFARGAPVIMAENESKAAWDNPAVRNLFAPPGAKGLTWVNQDTGEVRTKDEKGNFIRERPGSEWYSPELEQGRREFIAQVTPQEWRMAAAQKQVMVVAMQAANDTETRLHNRVLFPEEAFPHEDEKLSARYGLPPATIWGYTPRFRDTTLSQKFYSMDQLADAQRAGLLEELGVGKERGVSDKPLLVRSIEVVVDQRTDQLARLAMMQEDIRRALDFLGNREEQQGGFSETLVKNYGKEAVDATLAYLNRAAGFGLAIPVSRVANKIISNVLVSRLAFRPTSLLQNRYTSMIAAREWIKADGTSTGLGDKAARAFVKRGLYVRTQEGTEGYRAEESLLNDKNTGYFWKRWMKDMFRTYTQVDMDAQILDRERSILTQKMQNFAMGLFGKMEKKVAVAAFLAYKDVGLSDSQAVAKVEAMFRATQNPSDSLEESAALRKIKASNWGWMFPYIGQTMAMRNLLVDGILGLQDPTKRKASAQMIVAVAMSMVSSEVFRTIMRHAIKPDDEEEEAARRMKFGLNIARDAVETVAPGVGSSIFSLLQGNYNDKSMLATALGEAMQLPQLGIKALTMDETDEPIEAKRWATAVAKSAQAVASAAGFPVSGGIDQMTQAIIEQTMDPTKQETGKRRAVTMMDSLSDNPSRTEFDRAVRLAYRDGVDEGEVDQKTTSYREFRNRFRTRVIDKYGKDTARQWGYKEEKKKE